MEILRASSYYRDSHCFANRRMALEAEQMGVLPPEQTEFTERGIQVHAGKPRTLDEKDAYEFTWSRLEREMAGYLGDQDYVIQKEKHLLLRDGLVPYFSGHPDSFAITGNAIVFGDLKPGFEADWDAWATQINCYAALLYENFWHTGIEAIVGIIATRFYGVRRLPFTIGRDGRCEEMIDEIKSIATVYAQDAQDGKKAPTTAGPWCRYCKARLICQAALKLPVPYSKPEELPAGELGADIVDKLKLIQKIAKDRLKWYEDKVRNDPRFLAGRWKLTSRKTGKILDVNEATKIIFKSQLLTMDRVMECADLSAFKLREKLRKVHPGMTRDAAKKTLDDILGELIQYKESESWLVKADDPQLEE